MKKIQKTLIALTVLPTLLCPLTSCRDSNFENLVKRQATTLNYAGVRENLTIVSNVYEEVDLIDLGLEKNAYFLYGDRENIYFGIQDHFYVNNNTNQGSVTVKKYNFESKELSECSYSSNANRVTMKNADTFIYFTYEREGFLGYFKDKLHITEQNASGKLISSNLIEKKFSETAIAEYMCDNTKYYWSVPVFSPGTYQQEYIYHMGLKSENNYHFLSGYKLYKNGEPEYDEYGEEVGYDIFSLTESQNDVWKYCIQKEDYSIQEIFNPTDNGYSALCIAHYNANYDAYFAYQYGKDIEFLFSERNKDVSQLIGLYIF